MSRLQMDCFELSMSSRRNANGMEELGGCMRGKPQCGLQWPKPRLKVTPLIESLPIDGLTNLFGAGCVHAAFRLVEIETGRLELKVAESEDSPDMTLEIGNEVFVLNSEYLTRNGLVPVCHELHVHPIVTSDVLKTVGKLLSRGKQLLEVAETTRHGLSARIDDLGVRQDQVNESKMPKVVRHLVDEEGPVFSVCQCVTQVLLAQTPEVLWGKLSEYGWISRVSIVPRSVLKIIDQPRNIGQFHRAFHL